MNPEMLDKVMNCRDLPSLPAVAMRVIELTNSDRISIKELAETIQNDQALAAKVLRTVNSSLFGLRTRCASINQAIVMLGLSTVKTLALGFSLVGALSNCKASGFDLADHWRRALFTGIAGRAIASKAGLANPEEAFLGGLLQDVGVMAMVQTLGPEYLRVISSARGDHRQFCKFELDTLEIQHPDVGAMLARKWKLPDSLVMPIKYHEKATAAPSEYGVLCRCVGLGNIAADVLTATEPAQPLRKFYERAHQWFGLSSMQADDVLKVISTQTKEMSTLLSVPTGAIAKADEVLAQARKHLGDISFAPANSAICELSAGESQGCDELTGAFNRFRFEQLLIGAFEQTRLGVAPLAVAMFEIDDMSAINGQFGVDAGDSALIWVASRLERGFKDVGGVVARFSGCRFAVLATKGERAEVLKCCELTRTSIAGEPVALIAAAIGSPAQISLTCSVGVVAVDKGTIGRFENATDLLAVVEKALGAAHAAGKNAVRVFAPALAA